MHVMEGEGAGVALGDGVLQRVDGADHEQRSHAEPQTGTRHNRNDSIAARQPSPHCDFP